MEQIKKPIYKKWWFWVIIVVVLGFGAANQGNKGSTPASNSVMTDSAKKEAANTSSQAAAAESTAIATTTDKKPEIDFSKLDVTPDTAKAAIQQVVESDKFKSVEVSSEEGKTIVDIHFSPGMTWDEKDLVRKTANNAVNCMELLFKNPKVDKIWFWTSTKMTDPKGNESDEDVVNVCLSKENAKDINWPKFKQMVEGDYNKLFDIADSYFIYPSIKAAL